MSIITNCIVSTKRDMVSVNVSKHKLNFKAMV